MVDFIEEVEEQLRSDRYAAMARRYLPWFIAAVLAVIVGWLGVWGWQSWRDRNVGDASRTYDHALAALAQGDETGAYTAFGPVAKDGPPGYRVLALMQQGNIRLTEKKTAEAVALYDAAATVDADPMLRDLARLKAALALIDTTPYPQMQTRLTALIGDRKPFDAEAREALAMAKIRAGRYAEARGDLNALTLTLGVSQEMRARAQAAIALIDAGEGATIADVVTRGATMPPPDPATLRALLGAPAAPPASGAPDQAAAPDASAPDTGNSQ